ncbi:cyclodeaminase/cyclohydrolase family protein [Eubacteriales bacterium OttesenSCG-928-M02]|nr:cyclodeaminase/cyclohydrolase family protein [Eubacteriales bacterium OttesenSCG-928-M02]
MREMPLDGFIKKLGAKDAVPGGGSAAALCGAMSAALCSMAINLTVGKKKYADVEEELKREARGLNRLSRDFMKAMDADAEAFLPLSKAYGMPNKTAAEKERKKEVLESALVEASKPPLAAMRLCQKTVEVLERVEPMVSPLVISDVGCAAALCMGCVQAAALNVYINARMIEDEQVANRLMVEAQETVKSVQELARQIYQKVEGKLCR